MSLGNIKYWVCVFVMGVCLMACSSNDEYVNDNNATREYYIKLSLSFSNSTRAAADHPYGGEDGDGRENGVNFENDINDICIFIYNDAGNVGLNALPTTTPIKAKYYFNDLKLWMVGGIYQTLPLPVSGYVPEDGDRLLVITNRGDVTANFSTLADFHAKESNCWDIENQWTNNIDATQCSNFVMTSSKNDATYGKIDFTSHDGRYANPYEAMVEVQRIMARVDFWYYDANKGTSSDPRLVFAAEDHTGTLKLSHIRIFNMPKTKSTMPLKMVSTGYDETSRNNATLLGTETVETSTYIPNNYVHTFLTCQKNNTNAVDATWLNTYYKDNLAATMAKDGSGNPTFLTDDYKIRGNVADSHVFPIADADFGNINNYILGYAPENTMPKDQQRHQYMTGLALKGTFIPTTVYKWEGGVKIEDTSYTEGHDIWHYVDKEDPDPTHSYYFSSEAAVHAYEASRPAVAHSIDYYKNAECYYYIWIRHAMFDSGHATGTYPMEYAIVRNNIYRIGVEKVTTIGSTDPDPDEDPKAYSKIYVRKWRFRQAEETVL